MAELLNRLTEDMKAAMKAGQKDRLQVIRMLISDVKIIDMNPAKPTEQQAVEAYAKKLRKSAEEYEKIGRPEEVKKLKEELAVVEGYLPKKASAEETEKLVDEFLGKNAFTEKDTGKATGMFMKANAGMVEPGVVNGLMKRKLAGK
jgi:uncharacterized protein YqeY